MDWREGDSVTWRVMAFAYRCSVYPRELRSQRSYGMVKGNVNWLRVD